MVSFLMLIFSVLLPASTIHSAVTNSPLFNEAHLITKAEKQGFGYKTANLLELKKLTLTFNTTNPPIPIQVPEFVGIPSSAVIQSLNDANFNIAQEWKIVLDSILDEEKETALSSKQIPERFWVAQKQFITNLCAALKELNPKNPFNLDEEQQQALNKLFTAAQQDKLMVRSTGKEDTRKLANAGGNESIANVAPTMAAILAAAEKVVVSYFSEKSLNQRLGLGDTTLFAEEVFCPILIQRMIGEIKGQEIPSCGVMFTEEVEGGIGYQEELDTNRRIKTTGITMIQAAYGHNELVVNSKGAVDSFVAQMIDGKPVFYPVIKAKRKRLLPTAHGLEMVANTKQHATTSALNNQTLITLKQFANALEQHYGYPMDVEFVVRDNALWIVQARPITHNENRKNIIPQYFADLKALPQDALFKGRTIVSYGGALVTVENNNECIIADRIGTALDNYLKSSRDSIKSVFSGTDAPATSHEATTFRGEGKPVLYLPNIDEISTRFIDDKKLIFSPQQHCVLVADPEFEPEISDGWSAYPLPRELSVVPALFIGNDKQTKKEIEPHQDAADLQTLLTEMSEENNENALEAVQIFPAALWNKINVSIKNVKRDKNLNEQIMNIIEAAQILCTRISFLIENNAPLLERLLPINYLTALVYQQTFGEKELQYLSVATLGKTLKQEQIQNSETTIQIPKQAQELYMQLKKIDSIIFDDETKNAWNSLLTQLAKNKGTESLQALGSLVEKLQSFDILPLWLHSTMVNAVGENPTTATCNKLLKTWLDCFSESADSFNIIKQLSESVATFDIGRFADPKNFDDAWQELGELQKSFMDSKFTNIIKALSTNTSEKKSKELAAAAACNLISKFIELFDTSIKAMTGSNLLEKDKKPAIFQMMLKQYYALLENWVILVQNPQESLILPPKSHLSNYLEMMRDLVNKPFTEKDLEQTSGIDTTCFTLGSGHDWVQDQDRNKQPKTGEDVYTIIHQSLLNCCSALLLSCGVKTIKQPKILQNLSEAFDAIFNNTISDRFRTKALTGLSIDQQKIEVIYNIPLGSHSLQIYLDYFLKTKKTSVTLNFFGGLESEAYRWVNVAVLAIRYHVSDFLKINITKLHTHALSIVISNLENDITMLSYFISQLPDIIMTGASQDIPTIIETLKTKPITLEKTNDGLKILKKTGDLSLHATLRYYEILVKENHTNIFPIATILATKTIANKDLEIQHSGLYLFGELITSNHQDAFAIATVAATKAAENQNYVGLSLFTKLIKAKYQDAYTAAANAATAAILNTNKTMESWGFALFDELIRNEQIPTKIITIATEMFHDTDEKKQKKSLDLFNRLLRTRNKEIFKIITTTAAKGIQSDDNDIRNSSLELFNNLIPYDDPETLKDATKTAIELLKSEYFRRGLELFKKLFIQGYKEAFIAAIPAATAAIASDDECKEMIGLVLLRALIENNQTEACIAATKAAKQAIKKTHMWLKQEGIKLFKALVNINYKDVFTEAIVAATEGIKFNNWNKEDELELFKALVEKGEKESVYKALQTLTPIQRDNPYGLTELFTTLQQEFEPTNSD